MDVDPSILVTLLNPLEANDYLARKRDADDRRRHVVTITPRGEQQLERAAQAQRDAEDELLASLTDIQRDQHRALLLVLRQQLTPEHNTACTAAATPRWFDATRLGGVVDEGAAWPAELVVEADAGGEGE